jgi:hypothetical protein
LARQKEEKKTWCKKGYEDRRGNRERKWGDCDYLYIRWEEEKIDKKDGIHRRRVSSMIWGTLNG